MRATDLRRGCLRPRWHAGAPTDRPTGLGTRETTLAARHAPRIRSHFGRRRHHLYRPGGDSNKLRPRQLRAGIDRRAAPECTGRHTWDGAGHDACEHAELPHRRVTHEPAGPGSRGRLHFITQRQRITPQLKSSQNRPGSQAGGGIYLPDRSGSLYTAEVSNPLSRTPGWKVLRDNTVANSSPRPVPSAGTMQRPAASLLAARRRAPVAAGHVRSSTTSSSQPGPPQRPRCHRPCAGDRNVVVDAE